MCTWKEEGTHMRSMLNAISIMPKVSVNDSGILAQVVVGRRGVGDWENVKIFVTIIRFEQPALGVDRLSADVSLANGSDCSSLP